VGQPLFMRQGRSVRLTDAGRDYQRSVANSLEQLEAGYRRLEPYRKPGSVVIYAPHDFAARWLLPRLALLRTSVPQCEPWIDTSGTHVNFEEMEVSISIIRAREVGSHLVSQILFADALVPVASPTLMKRALKNPADLAKFPLIHDERPEGWNEWFESAGVDVDEVASGLDFSDSDLALEAAVQGHGIALASLPLLQDLFAGTMLVQVSAHALQTGHSWYAVSTNKELSEPMTKNTWDWLAGVSNQG
jgi:LysR family transcriptional regulator, glycine cleavage system transcriptional activator